MELAEKAYQLEEKAYIIDTLAAAYAKANRRKDAVRAQERAIELLKKEGETERLTDYEKRLELYKTGEPWVEK